MSHDAMNETMGPTRAPVGGGGSRPRLSPDFDLRGQLQTLWRQRWLVIGVMAVVVALAWGVISQITPLYTATASVMIDTRKTRFIDIKEVMSGMLPQMATVMSEVEVIRSRDLAERVADNLNLYDNPLFNPVLRPKKTGVIVSLVDAVRSLLPTKQQPDLSEEEKKQRERAAVVSSVLAGLSVTPVQQSLVITIAFRSQDPAMSVRMANAVADHYLLDQLETKFEATRRASTWLNQRLEGLRQSVIESERAVANYRANSGLIENRGVLPSQQQLSELNTQLIQVQAKRSEAEARVARLEALVRTDRGSAAADELIDSSLIQRLRESEAQLLRDISDLSLRYGDMHPKMLKAQAELTELRAKIGIEIGKLGQGMRNELGVLRARESALRDQIRRQEGTLVEQNRAEVRLHELEREAQANRMLYENFLGRFKETSEQEQIQQADARIISRAERPIAPSYPRKALLLAGAALGGLILGTLLVFVLEKMDNTFRGREELEDKTGIPALGMIPFIRKNKGRAVSYLLDRPASSFAEAFRSLWVSLSHGGSGGVPQVVAVTSSLPGEGKSLTALSLARTVALLGKSVVLVDCDLRRSSVARMLELSSSHCMDDLLAGRVDVDDALQTDPSSPVAIIPARSMERPPLDLLSSARMSDLLDTLRRRFDLIVLDCPPVMPVSEPQILGRLSDATLFCVRWDSTPRQVVQSALRLLTDVQVPLAGAVLTQVNVIRHAKYDYGDSGYYYGRYKSYYAD